MRDSKSCVTLNVVGIEYRMTILEFLELNAGQWFSHRTSHHVSSTEQSGLKANISIELLAAPSPDVMQICQKYDLDQSQIYAAQTSWESLPELQKKIQTGADLLVFVPTATDPQTGSVYRKTNLPQATSRYTLNSEDRLTLITEADGLHVEESIWLESPNVRLRHSVVLNQGVASFISFASEIRRITTPPAQA